MCCPLQLFSSRGQEHALHKELVHIDTVVSGCIQGLNQITVLTAAA